MIALYRPGPIKAGFVDKFIDRRAGRKEVSYPHPAFEPALKNTYGLPVYQEQVMQVSRDVCGFSGGESDTLRKAIGKKIRAILDSLEKKFIDGGVEHSGVPREVMESFWQDLLGFADYAFNKSHSVAYGTISYQTAYLKANFRPAFMASLMTTDSDNADRLRHEIDETRRSGIQVLPPDINLSHHEFALIRTPATDGQPEQNDIRFGLDAVKTVGSGAVEVVLQNRKDQGPFASFSDFADRMRGQRLVNKKNVESLIKVGAFDFDDQFSRQDLLDKLDEQLHSPHGVSPNQIDLFAIVEPEPVVETKSKTVVSRRQQLDWERELLGVYLSGHPLDDYPQPAGVVPIANLSARTESDEADDYNQEVELLVADQAVFFGLVSDFRVAWTRSKEQMAFVHFEDGSGEIDLPMFPRIYQENQKDLDKGRAVEVRLSAGRSGSKSDWQIDSLRWLDERAAVVTEPVAPQPPGRLWLKIRPVKSADELEQIKHLLLSNPGQSQPILVIDDGHKKEVTPLPQIATDSTESLIGQLEALEAVEMVKFTPSV